MCWLSTTGQEHQANQKDGIEQRGARRDAVVIRESGIHGCAPLCHKNRLSLGERTFLSVLCRLVQSYPWAVCFSGQ